MLFATACRPRLWLLIAVIAGFVVSLVILHDSTTLDRALNLVRPTWFYINGFTRFDFQPTSIEQACFEGTVERINAINVSETIPKIVHFITGVDRPNPITLTTWLAIRAAAANLGPDVEIRLHHVFLSQEGPWWPSIQNLVTLVSHEPNFLDEFSHISPPPAEWHAAHKADILRLQILRSQGGIYLDTDVILLRPLDLLLEGRRDVVMGYEGGNRIGMCNAVILAKRGAPFLDRWYDMYSNFDPTQWNYHSVVLPAKLTTAYEEEICPLSPSAFFWPLWTDDQVAWMHKSLDHEEAVQITRYMREYNGTLFPQQLAYHATGSIKHMRARNVRDILRQNTRFNMLVRRYVVDV